MSSTFELSYDREDFELSENSLKLKYAFTGEHPEYSTDKWLRVPYDYFSPLTYWDWVVQCIQQDANHADLSQNQGTLPL